MNDNATKRKIIETMYQLVAEKGYDKTSIGQIAAATGITKASVYYYFKSKEDIFLQMISQLYQEDYSQKSASLQEKHTAAAYLQELISLGEICVDSYFEHQDLRKVYAEIDIQTTRIPALKEFINANDQRFNQFLQECLAQGIAVGAFPKDFDTAQNAQVLYAILIGIDQAILYDLPIEPKTVWRTVILTLFDRKARTQS